MKGKGKRILSGLLSLLTILTSVVQPVVTYAAEPEPAGYEAQYPAMETIIVDDVKILGKVISLFRPKMI